MEKRFILFLIITFLLMFSYPYVIERLGLLPPPPQPIQEEAKEDKEEQDEGAREIEEVSRRLEMDFIPPEREETFKIDTPLYEALFSSRGGHLLRWELKKYMSTEGTDPVVLYQGEQDRIPALSVQTPNPELNKRLREAIYKVEGESMILGERREKGHLAFYYQDQETGSRITKRYSFSAQDYSVAMEIETEGFSETYALSVGTEFGITNWGDKRGFIGFIGPITYTGGEMVKDKPSKIEGEIRHEGPITWAALQDKYFIAAIIPAEGGAGIVSREGETGVNTAVEFTPKKTGLSVKRARLYAGPKEHDRLKSLEVHLEETVDFGWFMFGSWSIVRYIAKPLFYILGFFNGYLGNYGVAIILLTVCVRVLFIPLSHKSYRSMKGLKVLQPQLQALQKKHKDDKQQLQKEMMALYQQNKVNPLGGCLPMFLQIPVFVALFNVLYTTIELRQAPFMLWIQDLSDKDPFYVLPVIMGLTMVVQQKIQPTAMEPMQAKIMMLMPVFITFLFLSFPTGLVLYMLTNNVLTITQQYLTMKYFEKSDEKPSGEKKPDDQTPGDNEPVRKIEPGKRDSSKRSAARRKKT